MPSVKILNRRHVALELEGGLLGVIKALISRPDQDPAAPVWLSNLGKVNNILVPTFPSCKRKGMLFPCCRGTLGIELLSEADGEYGKCACGSGSQPMPQCWIFLTAHSPEDPPEHDPDNSSMPSPLLPEHTLSAAALGNVHISFPIA